MCSLYLPFYLTLKLNLIAQTNTVEAIESDLYAFEAAVFHFFKFGLPLWLFNCNIMVPYMILNRENGS